MVPDPNTQESTWLTGADGTIDLREKVIAISMPCVECEYDLRGAPAAGQCAECGASIAEALAHAIDPVAHRLPSLANPRAVGDGLVAAAGAMTAGTVLPLLGLLANLLWSSPSNDAIAPLRLGTLTATVLVCTLGTFACWAMRPREGGPLQREARRAVRLLAAGMLVLTAGLSLLLWDLEGLSMVLSAVECIGLGLLLSLVGLRRVLIEAGRRSRHFRTATLGRQHIAPVVLAILLSMGLFYGFWLLGFGPADQGMDTALTTLALLWLVATGMLALGLLYLLFNVWWIRVALHRPPPRLLELVADRPSATSAAQAGA